MLRTFRRFSRPKLPKYKMTSSCNSAIRYINDKYLHRQNLTVSFFDNSFLPNAIGMLQNMPTCNSTLQGLHISMHDLEEEALGFLILQKRPSLEPVSVILIYMAPPVKIRHNSRGGMLMMHSCTEPGHFRKGYNMITRCITILIARCFDFDINWVGSESNRKSANALTKLGFYPASLKFDIDWEELMLSKPRTQKMVLGDDLVQDIHAIPSRGLQRAAKRKELTPMILERILSFAKLYKTASIRKWIDVTPGASEQMYHATMVVDYTPYLIHRTWELLQYLTA